MSMAPNSSLLKGYVDSDARVDRLRRANRYRAMQSELVQQEAENLAEEERQRKVRAAAREAALANELQTIKQDNLRQEKMVQLVREQAPELRDLEKKLQAAYAAKERKQQMEEVKSKKKQEADDEKLYMDALLADAKKAEEADQIKRQQQQKVLKDQQDAQMDQMASHSEMLAAARLQHQKEKAEVDAVVAKVQEEDFLDALTKLEKQRATKAEHDAFLEKREQLKHEEKQRREAEDTAIRNYMAEQNKRKESDARLRREKEAAKAKVLEEQSRQISAERAKKEELEMLVNEYYEEQRSAKLRYEEEQEKERRRREKEMMLAANEQQMRLKKQRQEAEMAEEQEFRRKMMERFAEDDRIDNLNRQKRMQMKAEHARKVTELIDEKRRLRDEDLERERLLAEQATKKDDERRLLIQRERARMIAEHAKNLDGFMPKGVGLTDADWELLKNGQMIPQ